MIGLSQVIMVNIAISQVGYTHTTYYLIKPYFLISIGFTDYNIQSNSTTLALYGGEEDQGNLYIYKLDGT